MSPTPSPPKAPSPWFGADKVLHFGLSAVLAGAGYAGVLWLFDGGQAAAIATGAGFSLIIGGGKELSDFFTGGHPSWIDFAWDVAGTFAGLAVSWFLFTR